MLDFLMIGERVYPKKPVIDIYPKFIVKSNSEDLMIRGGDFYAVYNEDTGQWVTDEQYVIDYVDQQLRSRYKELSSHKDCFGKDLNAYYMMDSDSGSIDKWHKYVQKQMRDQYHQLDEKIVFANTKIKKTDYVTKRLEYSLEEGSYDSYEEIMSTLYESDERVKLEWAIGAIIKGDSKMLQKFIVLYGSAGSGKSTFLNIVEQLFEGYWKTFSAKALGSSNSTFAMESFKDNPLIAIQHDGDLSRIEDNTRLNSIVSHETIEINAKFEKLYSTKLNSFLFMGTNKPVKITEAKSGLIRRLIDVRPSGRRIPQERYEMLMSKIKFELGAIAYHCLQVYEKFGKHYYDAYVPKDMMSATNDFYDFVDNYFEEFDKEPYIALRDAWGLYKEYCEYANVAYPLSMRQVRVELKNYFRNFEEQAWIDNRHLRNVYSGFLRHKFDVELPKIDVSGENETWLELGENDSVFDHECYDCQAQLAKEDGSPKMAWSSVKTKLSDIDTHELHYVRPPENHIVIDFDIKDESGNKSLELNIAAASQWPKTYAEVSKSGQGLHLHYLYSGDVAKISYKYDDNIEIKVFKGKSSLRRKLTLCNTLPVAVLNSGLPFKEEKKMLDFDGVMSEKRLRSFLKNCLAKKHHGATKPEMDFMKKVLEDCYDKGVQYDVSDMKAAILGFAGKSSNQNMLCLKIARNLPYVGKVEPADVEHHDGEIIFFDVEVFPNLFVLVFKQDGKDHAPVTWINPSALDIKRLCEARLVGFNCRRYDNHILYGRMVENFDNYQLYRLSQNIINGRSNAMFRGAYNLSYTDIYDFSSKKQSLKKFEIELGIHHQELGLPWDQEVPDNMWELVAKYCVNDVIATEAVWNARKGDFIAREILADLAGMSVNSTTNSLTTKIIFGNDKNPDLVYTDLSTGKRYYGKDMPLKGEVVESQNDRAPNDTAEINAFPGYKYDAGVNMYRGEDVGKGGYVYAEPGIHTDVALLDVASMHPTSIELLNLFGSYTERFSQLKQARIYIKHRDFDSAKMMLDGKLAPYLDDEEQADALAFALKIAINSVYGLTAASFINPFRDGRNINNIVALRGALFMVDLKHAVQEQGFTVAHIKTDSIKIPNATPKIIDFVMEFGKKYGYEFEHEATYKKMCLVNNAVYIAKMDNDKWTATGTQFQVPYVFKTMFSKEPIEFEDLCETKSVTTALYLDMNEELGEDEHEYKFVGKVGLFCPIKPKCGGGWLMREKDGQYNSAGGAKGYRWLEAETVKELHKEDDIDKSYYDAMVDEAIETISKYGDYEAFVS